MDVLIDTGVQGYRFAKPISSTRPLAREPEAPDRGHSEREAPEAQVGHLAEAPDAGEGRRDGIEQEFTHGRSQS